MYIAAIWENGGFVAFAVNFEIAPSRFLKLGVPRTHHMSKYMRSKICVCWTSVAGPGLNRREDVMRHGVTRHGVM